MPLIAGGLVVALIALGVEDDVPAPIEETADAPAEDTTRHRFRAAHLTGHDTRQRPYAIHARTGSADDEQGLVALEHIKGHIGAADDEKRITMTARHGAMDDAAGRVSLRENVVFTTASGYTMHTENLDIDIESGVAESDTPVHGRAPSGTFHAEGMTAEWHEGKVRLRRGVLRWTPR